MLNRAQAHQPMAAYTNRAVTLGQAANAATPAQPGDQTGPVTDLTTRNAAGYTSHVMQYDRDLWDDDNAVWG